MTTTIEQLEFQNLTSQEKKDLKILALFTKIWCRVHHPSQSTDSGKNSELMFQLGLNESSLCDHCRDFLLYALERRIKCPLDPKPACKHCQIHCYRPGHREKIKEIMRFSGKYLLKRGRLDLLWHYLF